MKTPRWLRAWLRKIPACGAAHAPGTLAGPPLAGALGMEVPGPIEGADPRAQALLPFPGRDRPRPAEVARAYIGHWDARTVGEH